MFEMVASKSSENVTVGVEVSYYEIYNEKIKDLLSPKNSTHSLKVGGKGDHVGFSFVRDLGV